MTEIYRDVDIDMIETQDAFALCDTFWWDANPTEEEWKEIVAKLWDEYHILYQNGNAIMVLPEHSAFVIGSCDDNAVWFEAYVPCYISDYEESINEKATGDMFAWHGDAISLDQIDSLLENLYRLKHIMET